MNGRPIDSKKTYGLMALVRGTPPAAARPPEETVPAYPRALALEGLVFLAVLVALWACALAFDAPLEELADPTHTPNPAKAPWYFVALQELLVYFDPWIAGVMLPTLILFGLVAIPFLDPGREGTGRYALRERPLAVTTFLAGLGLWVALLLIGECLRGPSWQIYWPGESWEIHKPMPGPTRDLPVFWGIFLSLLYVVGGLIATRVAFRGLRARLGLARFLVLACLYLAFLAVPAKILLRLAWNVKYVLVTPWFKV